MTPLQIALAVSALVVVLWVAYKIGKVILRVAAGLAFLALIAAAVWYLTRSVRNPKHPTRSHHGSHLLPPLRGEA